MRRTIRRILSRRIATAAAATLIAAACSGTDSTGPRSIAASRSASNGWGPEIPGFNLEAILRAPGGGQRARGHVKFRQPNDDQLVINLDVLVRDLAPNTHYSLQRAVDTHDGICTSQSWLTLGRGAVAQDIVTDADGDATESLFRTLTTPLGTEFDIRFRVVLAGTTTVVLLSDCEHFTVSQ